MATRFHGLTDGDEFHFGMALWPYDLLLRFGYDLPEHEHIWEGKWFDDGYDSAARDLRATAVKLMLTLRSVHHATHMLKVVVEGDATEIELQAAVEAAETAPLHLDLAHAYLQWLGRALACVLPCCYGWEGRALIDSRHSLQTLASSAALCRLDPGLARLLRDAPAVLVGEVLPATHAEDLYVITRSSGSVWALPKAGMRALRESGRTTLASAMALAESTRALSAWLDGVLSHMQGVVAGRCEPGEELRARWAIRDWSMLMSCGQEAALYQPFWPALDAD